jgi:hypothetical protein
MTTVKPLHADGTDEAEDLGGEAEFPYDALEIVRVSCPECGQPIALLADEEELPEHARCPTRWNPFGLTVCRGSGRPAAEAAPTGGLLAAEEDAGVLLTLPEGLNWRTQPFSHARRPRPLRLRAPWKVDRAA